MTNEQEHPRRRSTDMPIQPVEVDYLRAGAKKIADQFIVLMFGVLLAFVTGFPATLWAGSRWTARIEGELKVLNGTVADVATELTSYKAQMEAVTASLSSGIAEIDRTMTRVVTNQENLQARVDRLERNDDQNRVN